MRITPTEKEKEELLRRFPEYNNLAELKRDLYKTADWLIPVVQKIVDALMDVYTYAVKTIKETWEDIYDECTNQNRNSKHRGNEITGSKSDRST